MLQHGPSTSLTNGSFCYTTNQALQFLSLLDVYIWNIFCPVASVRNNWAEQWNITSHASTSILEYPNQILFLWNPSDSRYIHQTKWSIQPAKRKTSNLISSGFAGFAPLLCHPPFHIKDHQIILCLRRPSRSVAT